MAFSDVERAGKARCFFDDAIHVGVPVVDRRVAVEACAAPVGGVDFLGAPAQVGAGMPSLPEYEKKPAGEAGFCLGYAALRSAAWALVNHAMILAMSSSEAVTAALAK